MQRLYLRRLRSDYAPHFFVSESAALSHARDLNFFRPIGHEHAPH